MAKKHYVRIISLILVAVLLIFLSKYSRQLIDFFTKLPSSATFNMKPKSAALPPSKAANSENIILNMHGYTIQLMSVYNFNTLKDFATANRIENKTYIFHSIKKGQDWYTLIYGNYPTRKAAQAMQQQLPGKLKALHPWIRSMDSIHTAILQSGK